MNTTDRMREMDRLDGKRRSWRTLALAWLIVVATARADEPKSAVAAPPEPGAAPLASAKAAEPRIVFNFQNAPWDAVLARFAEEAGLSLILDVRPAGTFSYAETQPRTLAEALDLLNGVLLTKDFILLRSERFLTLVPLDAPLPADLVPQVSPEELATRGGNELVSVLLPMNNLDPSGLPKEIKGMMSKHGQIIPLARLKLVKLVDLASRLRELIPLVRRMDEAAKPGAPPAPPPPKTQKILPLTNLDGARLAPILKELFPGISPLSASPDGKSVIATATEGEHEQLAKLVQQLDQPPKEPSANTRQVYPLRNTRAEKLSESLQALFPKDSTKATFAADATNNVLLLDADPTIHAQVAALLEKLDAPTMRSTFTEAVYRPRSIDARALLASLEGLYRNDDVRMSLDPAGESVLVRAPKEVQERVAKLVEDLDRSDVGDSPMAEEMVKLKHAKAESLAGSFRSLFPTERTRATFTSESTNNLLIVRAPKNLVERIKTLAAQIDIPTGLGGNAEKIYRPKNLPAADLIKTLQSLYTTSTNVMAFPAPGGQGILLSVPQEIEEEVQRTLDLIDQVDPAVGPTEDRIHELKVASAETLARTLEGLFPASTTQARISADATHNIVIVSAPARVHERIAAMIEKLDAEPANTPKPEIITPKNVTPQSLSSTLGKLFGNTGGVTISLDPQQKSLIVVAPAEALQRMKALIEKLDVALPAGEGSPVDEVYKLRFASATELAESLRKLYPPETSPVKISPDPANQILIISAPPSVHERIKPLLQKVDVPPESRLEEKIYRPKRIDASSLSSAAQTLYNRDGKSTFTLTDGNKAVLVVAPALVHAKIEKLLEKLDAENPDTKLSRQLYRLKHASSSYLASAFVQMFPSSTTQVSIGYDPVANTIIVSAPPAMQAVVGELIDQADQPSDPGTQEKSLQPQHLSATALAAALNNLFSGVQGTRITTDPTGKTVIITANPTMLERIDRLVARMDAPPMPGAEVQQVYKMRHGTAAYAASTLQTLFPTGTEAGRYSYDGANNAVIVVGPQSLHDKIKPLLETLDADPRSDVVERTYAPKHQAAPQVLPLLQNAMSGTPRTTFTLDPQRQSIIVLAPRAEHVRIEKLMESFDRAPSATDPVERKLYKVQHANASSLSSTIQTLYPPASFPLTVATDAANATVIVEAPASLQERIRDLVAQIDVQTASDLVDKVYTLAHGRAERYLTPLRNLLSSDGRSRVVGGPDASSLIVTSTAEGHQRVADFVKQFDRADASGQVQEKLYRLRNSQASSLANSLQTLFANESVTRITSDDRNNAIVAVSDAAGHERIQRLIDEFDRADAQLPRAEKVFALKNASANDIAQALRGMFIDPKVVTFAASSGNNSILVSMVPELEQRVTQAIENLDQPRKRIERIVEVFPLYVNEPFAAEDALEGLFSDLSGDERPIIDATFDPPQIVARGTAEQMNNIRDLLAKLGEQITEPGAARPGEPAKGRTVRTIRTDNADPRTIAESIAAVWPRLRRNPIRVVTRGERTGDMRSRRDPSNPIEVRPQGEPIAPELLPGDERVPVILTPGEGRLVAASADVEALLLVEEIARSLTELPDPRQGEFTIFYLNNASADDVARSIDEAFNGRDRDGSSSGGSRRSRTDRVRVIADASANALIVRATPVDLLNVQRLIESLDSRPEAPARGKAPRVIRLRHVDAAEVVEVLREVYADYLIPGSGGPIQLPGFSTRGSSSGRTAALSVGIDERANSLVVSAPPALFDEIQSLVQGMDESAVRDGRTYRVMPLRHTSPLDVRDALRLLLDQGDASRRTSPRPAPQRTPRSRKSSSQAESKSASDVARTPEPTPLPTSVLKPSNGGETAITTIRRTAEGVKVAHQENAKGDTILASHSQTEESASDEPPNPAGADVPAKGTEPVPPEMPENPVLEAERVSGKVDIQALPELGVLLLLGNRRDLGILAGIVDEIEKVTLDRQLGFQIIPLNQAKASAIARLVDDLYQRILAARGSATLAQSQSEVIALAKPNALLVAAPKEDLPILVDLVARLDVPVRPEGEFRVFRLEHAQAADVASIAEGFFTNRQRDGDLAVQVLIESDPRSNTLIAQGSPRDLDEVAAFVRQVDVATSGTVNELRVFSLKNAVANELEQVLRQAIEGRTGTGAAAGPRRPGAAALRLVMPDAQEERTIESGILDNVRITANERANTLVVSAPGQTMGLIAALIGQLDVVSAAVAEIKVFTLHNSDALALVQTLRTLFAPAPGTRGQVAITPTATGPDTTSPLIDLSFSVDERTNSILATGSTSQLEVVEAIILRLDGSNVEQRQTSVYRLLNAPAADVAIALTDLLRAQNELVQLQEGVSLQQQIESEVIVVPEPVSNSLLISSTPRFYTKLLELIRQLDEPPPQVVIQVLIVEVELDKTKEFGVELGLQDSILFDRGLFPGTASLMAPFTPAGVSINTNSPNTPGIPGFDFNNGGALGNNPFTLNTDRVGGQGLSNFSVGRTSNLGYGGLVLSASSESVSVLLRALARDRKLDVLSRPQIMTMDNQQAFIQVGQQVPLITNSVIQANIGVVNTVEYQDVGIILLVLPKINPDGSVIMRVDPEVSALASILDLESRVEISPDVFARAINTTRAQTTVSARDGQTAIIGGLIRKTTDVETRKVPILGDIPILGIPFRFDQKRNTKRELLIFLTPRVVYSDSDANRVKVEEASRLDWCLQDVEKIHGDMGLDTEVYIDPQVPAAPEEIHDEPNQVPSRVVPQAFPLIRREKSSGPTAGSANRSASDPQVVQARNWWISSSRSRPPEKPGDLQTVSAEKRPEPKPATTRREAPKKKRHFLERARDALRGVTRGRSDDESSP